MTDILTFTTDAFGDHRWHVTAPNGEIVLSSGEGYVRRADAEANARRHLILAGDGPDEYRVLNRQPAGDTDLLSMTEATYDAIVENARVTGRQQAAVGDGAGHRIVLVKPGDTLIFGNVTTPDDPADVDALSQAFGVLKHALDLGEVFVFNDDIDMRAIPTTNGATP